MKDIILYRIHRQSTIHVRKGVREREWMENSQDKYAYRCLPLTIANQNGFEVSTSQRIKINWNGGNHVDDITIEGGDRICVSHFGGGVVTFHPDFIVRTPENVNLYVSGTPNNPKRGIAPLTGIVETDWNPATFTMNWIMTEPDREIVFEPFEPFLFFYPMERKYVEEFRSIVRPLELHEEEVKNYEQWSKSRGDFDKLMLESPNTPIDKTWEKHYFQGVYPDGRKCPIDHQTKIKLNLKEE